MTTNKDEQDINLTELATIFYRKKVFIFLVTSLFISLSIFYSLSLNNIYTSSALVKAVDNSDSTPDIASQFGGIASLTGISLGSPKNDKGEFFKKSVSSRVFMKHILSFENIEKNLAAAKSFDIYNQKIIYDDQMLNTSKNEWIKSSRLSYLEIYQDYYLDGLSVLYDKETGFISISFSHISPIFAKELLDLLINQINEQTRKDDLDKSKKSLDYLYNLYQKEKSLDIRSAISQLIQSQLQTQTFAYVQEEYLIEVIDPPFIPEKKSSPQRAIICILGAFFGFILSIIMVIIRTFLIDEKIQ